VLQPLMLSVMIEAFNNKLETLIVPMAALVSLCVTVRVDFLKGRHSMWSSFVLMVKIGSPVLQSNTPDLSKRNDVRAIELALILSSSSKRSLVFG
jgi:hypothetical protein